MLVSNGYLPACHLYMVQWGGGGLNFMQASAYASCVCIRAIPSWGNSLNMILIRLVDGSGQ